MANARRRRRSGRGVTVAVAALLAATGLLVGPVGASPAQAASCEGSSCYGRDPRSTGCDSNVWAGPYRFIPSSIGISVRWSRVCHTWWARFFDDVESGGGQLDLRLEQQILVNNIWIPYANQFKRVYASPVYQWTGMLPDRTDDRVRACMWDSCTDWAN